MEWNRLLSRQRLGAAESAAGGDARTDFQRDFDRIVFSSALRRLQDKTQVFPLAQNDYVRTRLTHSLEVSSVGRTLGVMVGDTVIQRHGLSGIHPQDFGAIVAAAGLAHDIGNPPFGHAGEDAIRMWFATSATAQAALAAVEPEQREDLLQFEGNAQGFRLICRLQNPDNRGGLQLTSATLGAFTKYPRASSLPEAPPDSVAFKKFGFFHADKPLFAEVAQQLGLRRAAIDAWHRHPLAYLMEAADDICYRIIDVEDAFRLGRLGFADARDLLAALVQQRDVSRLQGIGGDKERIEFLRAKAIGHMIAQAHSVFLDCEQAVLDGELATELLDQIPAAAALDTLKSEALKKIYFAPEVVEVGAAGYGVLSGLLDAFVGAVEEVATLGAKATSKSRMLLHLIPAQFVGSDRRPAADAYQRLLSMADFVSGMTDTYAINLYRKITGISLPS